MISPQLRRPPSVSERPSSRSKSESRYLQNSQYWRRSQYLPSTHSGRKRASWFTCTKHDDLGSAVPRRAIRVRRRALAVGESLASAEGAFALCRIHRYVSNKVQTGQGLRSALSYLQTATSG